MIVENIPATSAKKCGPCGSWLKHYNKHTGWTLWCQAKGCGDFAEVGAHVRNARGGAAKEHFIVGFCKKHNGSTSPIDIGNAELAPAKACV